MIQDIQPHVFDNRYFANTPRENDYIFLYNKRRILMKIDVNTGKIVFPRFSE